jgi:dihydrofolate synthase/folylpolyglutamate synthase
MQLLLETLELAGPPKSILIVGTNGKGSVTAMLAAAYLASGRRVGKFLSPHVEDFSERIGVGNDAITSTEVTAFLDHVMRCALPFKPSFFELSYAMALDHFARHNISYAFVEAGIGGTNDVTATLANVEAVVITNVGLDHVDTLGPTLEEIAHDKAGAIRPGRPVITAARGRALDVIKKTASQRGSPLFVHCSEDPLFTLPGDSADGALGTYHRQNRQLATGTLRLIGNVAESAIHAGLHSSSLPARLERFPLATCEVILDGAHNPSAAEALCSALPASYLLVFGAKAGKKAEETLTTLERGAQRTVITYATEDGQPPVHLRGERTLVPDPLEALTQAIATCPPHGTVVVAGSFYLAGKVRPFLRQHTVPRPC